MPEGLWEIKKKAIGNLERSLAGNKPRSLLQMATGSGKTLTAVVALYRLIKYAGAKRILLLVDRNNLGRQTYREFQQYVSPVTGYKFTDEYNVQHLRANTIDLVCKVCITTIQRLFSMLKGEAEFDEAAEERSQFEAATGLIKDPVPVEYNPKIPIETFDFIITDECHRSIYNVWRQVLDYFDAFLIGLTATPTKQTIGFFKNNLVMEYGHEQAVADGVNVPFDVYGIQTKITGAGASMRSGHCAAKIMEPASSRCWHRAKFLAIRHDLAEEWLPRSGIERQLIDTMAQAQTSYMFWLEKLTARSTMPAVSDQVRREEDGCLADEAPARRDGVEALAQGLFSFGAPRRSSSTSRE